MALDQIKVDINDLTAGMYVSKLDRPWINTPFPIQGYYIKNTDDINAIRKYCKFVYIDIRRGKSPIDPILLQTLGPDSRNVIQTNPNSRQRIKARSGATVYKNTTSPRKEVASACKIQELAIAASAHIRHSIQSGGMINVPETKRIVEVMVDHIIRNPDAFVWLNKIKNRDSYLYGHVVRSTLWAISMARHLGMSRSAMNTLSLAMMLSDVGKLKLPDTLLNKDTSERSGSEEMEYRKHVEYAIESLRKNGEVEPRVLAVIANMFEREDGSGYPRKLTGEQIPVLAKVAGISSYYDELTFPREDNYGLTPSDAMASLYRMRETKFNPQLVEEFIQAIGIYPAGTLVELSTRQTAMILEQNRERKLRPKVVLLLDEERNPYTRFKLVDLMKKEYTSDGMPIDIAYSLPIGAYGADPVEIYNAIFKKTWMISLAS